MVEHMSFRHMSKKIALFYRKPKEGPQKCPVYLKLPWIGKISLKLKSKPRLLSTDVTKLLNLALFLQRKKNLSAIDKDVLPSL